MILPSLGGKVTRSQARLRGLAVLAILLLACALAAVARAAEVPSLAERVSAGELPPLAERLPDVPRVTDMEAIGRIPGRYGGTLKMIMAKLRDLRQMVVYGYSRLVGYDEDFELVPDILERLEIEDNRIYTLYLRPGHKWSDGHPFTAEDFRYYWEDVVNNEELYPLGVPILFLVNGEKAKFEVIDETTVRYSWSQPNPGFEHNFARANPPFVYLPAHYLKQFHAGYVDKKELKTVVRKRRKRNWVALHHDLDNMYKNTNPELPSLQPWVLKTAPPAERFVYERNPFFHRVDNLGQQLPYIDRVTVGLADSKIIPAKTAAGETDLQARYLRFDNYTVLKEAERRHDIEARLWNTAKGSHLALYPNLTAMDPMWRAILRDARFRRALSLAINRHEINQVIYYGLAVPGQNTMLEASPLYQEEFRTAWADYDVDRANLLLDEMGLTARDGDGFRLLPNGERLQVIIDTAGERTEEVDVLELMADSWAEIGVKLFIKPSQRDMMRNRAFSGDAIMTVWYGFENGIANADMSPEELAPVGQYQLCWPRWGQYFETKGKAGEAPDLPEPQQLMQLLEEWRKSNTDATRERVWESMLAIHADQLFSIGVVSSTLQPVVVNRRIRNVPVKGTWNWDPGAHFGIHRVDTYWFEDSPRQAAEASSGTR